METNLTLSFGDFLLKYSPVGEQPYFFLDAGKDLLTEQEWSRLADFLPDLACPSLLLSPENRTSLTEEKKDLFDVCVSSEQQVEQLIKRIQAFPFAAMTLVQLLRHNQRVADREALLAESLAFSNLQQGEEFKQWLQTHNHTAEETSEVIDSPLLSTRENGQLTLTFNRPECRNAYNTALRDSFYEALTLLDCDKTIECCLINGAGQCFSVGGDLAEFGCFESGLHAHTIRSTRNVAHLLLRNRQRIECHLHRACIGSGIELPAFAGTVVATSDTFFQLPELSMGLIPGAGGTVSILRRIGRQRMNWWVLSGKKINAETALDWGLIDNIQG